MILDCNMPELSGLLVLRQMRDTLDLCHTPVLMLTGRRSERDSEIAFYEGADDYMKKPFDPEELVFRVNELLARKSAGAT
ncbi:response regulator transcription factor [uncultured Sphingomonas sp.]|uniref:response regulator transcription factor n=1 Tax=uncultured Sphingomonas sp. TaxID=158754 RepID=UPI0035CC3972